MRIDWLGLALSAMAGYAWGQPCQTTPRVDVLTHRNNNFRTGANLEETCLTWENVNTIQKLFTLKVQGQVYAQPLVKTNFQILNKVTGMTETHNVVFIATMQNWVYAYDADGLNQDASGAPWVGIVRGELRAFKINPEGTKLEPAWTSYCADPDDEFTFAKYAPPTVANGHVYLATFSDHVSVYGIPVSGAKPVSNPNRKVPPPHPMK